MTSEQQLTSNSKMSKTTKTILQMTAGGAFGFFGVLAIDRAIGLDVIAERTSGISIIAMTIALIFSLIGVICLAMASSRQVFMLSQPDAENAAADFDHMRPVLFWSAIVTFLYAAILVLMALASNAGGGSQLFPFWSIFALMLCQAAISVMLWNKYDELYRDVMKDSCAATFVIVEFGLFIWAAAAICGLGVAFDPLAVIVAITGVNVVTSVWFTVRRGMA